MMQKSEIINTLGNKYGFKSYLEISTPTTGKQFHLIDRTIFRNCERLVYGMGVKGIDDDERTYETAELSSGALIEGLLNDPARPRYDVVFVDPFHSYENSLEDLAGGFDLLSPNGALVVHDCNPQTATIASPSFMEGDWCGLTYLAYVDFVLGKPEIHYYTVDADYGCGIIFKGPNSGGNMSFLQRRWENLPTSEAARYNIFSANRRRLLNLVNAEEFRRREAISRLDERIVAQLSDAIEQSLTTHAALQGDVADAHRRLADLATENRRLKADIDVLINSTSWRALAPGRALARFLRKKTSPR